MLSAKKITKKLSMSINEDDYSSLTLTQMKKRLGESGFIHYVINLSTKIVKELSSSDIYGGLKNVNVDIDYASHTYTIVDFTNKKSGEFLEVEITTDINDKDFINLVYGKHRGDFDSDAIIYKDKNVERLIRKKLSTLYNSAQSQSLRKSLYGNK